MSLRIATCLLLLLAACGEPAPAAPPVRHAVALPRISAAPGAGVAWYATSGGMAGITAVGRELTLDGTPITNASTGVRGLRSADGGHLYVERAAAILVASAVDGGVERTIGVPLTGPLFGSISADAHWLWLAPERDPDRLLLVDLERGAVVASGTATQDGRSTPFWPGFLALPDGRLVAVARGLGDVVVVSARGQGVELVAHVRGSDLSCNSPDPPTLHVAADGTAVAGYCPFDGTIWWFDLVRLRLAGQVRAQIGNPFWGAPEFSADGRLLYVYDSWGGNVSEVDLVDHRVLSVTQAVHPAVAFRLPFVTDAFAKGPNFSAALSADGSTLLVLGPQGAAGVYALATATWAVRGRWLEGRRLAAVWAAGDGAAVFVAEASDGQRGPGDAVVDILDTATGGVRTVRGPAMARGGFAAG